MDSKKLLQFYPFASQVDPSFWHILSEKKLNEYKLNETPTDIFGFYRIDEASNLPPIFTVNYQSFQKETTNERNCYTMYGSVMVLNTLESFKSINKKELLKDHMKNTWNKFTEVNESNTFDPSKLLSNFLLVVYADLKKFHYYYWFAFPAFCYPENSFLIDDMRLLSQSIDDKQINKLHNLHTNLPIHEKAFFLTQIRSESGEISIHSLLDFERLKLCDGKIFVSFADPCKNIKYPGWILRNLIAFMTFKYRETNWNVICYRLTTLNTNCSIEFEVVTNGIDIKDNPSVVGWEKNQDSKLLPRFVDLSSSFDPKKLAGNSIDLNLKLMRWRLIPDLELEKIFSLKCLLLGAGTLGCNVARCLMAWGVKNITFVDNGKVSYSNPVRQSLFEFKDSVTSGTFKAVAAAEALKRICPVIEANGHVFSIPMPGHHVSEAEMEQTKADVTMLEDLIKNHDCIFLLTDTRESRWLPTLLAQSNNKLVINAALGFDSYLIQRHGNQKMHQKSENDPSKIKNKIPGNRLGCYFCNDVVAPGNSTRNRTLDQQCTVTRPGLSMIAAGLAVELMISVIQHPDRTNAPASINWSDSGEIPDMESCLGIIPHQIRGFLSQFSTLMPTSLAFDCCTACSKPVINAYEQERFELLLKVFEDVNYLEDISGLKKLHEEVNMDDVWALSDNESDSG